MGTQKLILALAASAALFTISGSAQVAQDNATLEERVAELEQALEEARSQLAGLSESAAVEAATLDAVTVYLQNQAKQAAEMTTTLAKAEKQGFVAGINYPSRETLLAGWRSQLLAQQKGLPGDVPPEAELPDRRARR